MSARSSRLRRSGLLLLWGLACFFSVEIGLRVFQPKALQYYRNVKLFHVYNENYLVGLPASADLYIEHHRGLWAGHFTTNSLGFRGSPEPDPARPQLGCLGDSIVMGFGVSDGETFCALLEGVRVRGQSHQALNLGLDAFGSLGSARRLAEAAPKLNLRTVLFFPSPNDFTMPEALRAVGQLSDDEKDAVRFADPDLRFWFRLQFEATRISYALQALKLAYEQLRIRRVQTIAAVRQECVEAGVLVGPNGARASPLAYVTDAFYRGPPKRECARVDSGRPAPDYGDPATFRKRHCPHAPLPGTVCSPREPRAADLQPLPEITVRAYREMIATAQRHGIRLVVVLLPIQNEVLQCTQNGTYSRYFDFAIRLRAFFQAQSIPVLDLRPYVARMCGEPIREGGHLRPSAIRDYFIPGDGHFTVLGNQWAAEAIRRGIAERGF